MMSNMLEKITKDARANLRVKDDQRIQWRIQNSDVAGSGRIRNISSTGMMMEASVPLNGSACIFDFQPFNAQLNFIPQSGRLVWHKKNSFLRGDRLYGIEFINPDSEVISRLRERIQQAIMRFTSMRKMQGFLSIILFAVIAGLTAYVMWMGASIYENLSLSNDRMTFAASRQSILVREYQSLYQTTQQKLVSTVEELTETKTLYAQSTADLASTKAVLSQTEQLLNQAREELRVSQVENEKKLAELRTQVTSLEETRDRLTIEMTALQKEISYYQGNVESVEQSKSWFKSYRTALRTVKGKIREFNYQAALAHKAAVQERDRLRSMIGNNGYFMRDGQKVSVDMEKYNALDSSAMPVSKKVEIDVRFFE